MRSAEPRPFESKVTARLVSVLLVAHRYRRRLPPSPTAARQPDRRIIRWPSPISKTRLARPIIAQLIKHAAATAGPMIRKFCSWLLRLPFSASTSSARRQKKRVDVVLDVLHGDATHAPRSVWVLVGHIRSYLEGVAAILGNCLSRLHLHNFHFGRKFLEFSRRAG